MVEVLSQHVTRQEYRSVPKKSTPNLGSNEVLLSFVWFWVGDVPDCRLIDVASGAGAAPLSDADLCPPCILHGDRKRDFVTKRDIFCQHVTPTVWSDRNRCSQRCLSHIPDGDSRTRWERDQNAAEKGALNVRTTAAVALTRVSFSCYV